MLQFKSSPMFTRLLAITATLHLIDALEMTQGSFSEPLAEERKFIDAEERKFIDIVKQSPFGHKKNWFWSMVAQPQSEIHSFDKSPIWKIHKYKGLELRPVQIIAIPVSYDHVHPVMYNPPVRMPHTEYGLPSTDYQPLFYASDEPVSKFQHGKKLAPFFSILKWHKSLLGSLKNWKFGKLRNHSGFAVALPEVEEVPVKGIESIRVPELPQVRLPYYSKTFTTGPYVSFTFGNPSQQPTFQEPAPYYGAPPLYDSYGTPLPPDAYSSAPSQPVPSFAVPETIPTDYTSKIQDISNGKGNMSGSSHKESLLQEVSIKKSDSGETHLKEQENEQPMVEVKETK